MSDDVIPPDTSTLDEKIISIKAHTDKFLQRFSNAHAPATTSKAVGNETIARQLCLLLDNELDSDYMLAAIELHGAPKVDAAVRLVAQKLKTSKIANLGAFLGKAIREDWAGEKTSRIEQKRPSSGYQSPVGNSNPSGIKNNDFSGGVSNLNAIEELKKEHHWSLAENQAFYRRLSRDSRQPIVNDVTKKWFYLPVHAKNMDADLLGSEFTDHNLFIPFSEILNNIRLEQAAHSLRSKIWNES